jgi:hypothetical protein
MTTSPCLSVGTRTLLDVGQEQFSVDRTVDDKRGGQAVAAQCAHKGGRLPMPMRHGCDQAVAAFCPAIAPCHGGLHRAFIDENQLRRGQLGLLLTPFDTRLGNVLTLLLGSVEGLF